MTFSYPVLSEEEAQKERFTLLENGVYNFTVTRAVGKMSKPKPGKEPNPMIELQITVWDKHGREHYLYDYLVGSRNMAWKTRHFCESVGLVKEYESQEFNEYKAVNRSGKALIGFQEGKQKPEGGFYKDKNVIEDYVLEDAPKKIDTSPIKDKFEDSEIPF